MPVDGARIETILALVRRVVRRIQVRGIAQAPAAHMQLVQLCSRRLPTTISRWESGLSGAFREQGALPPAPAACEMFVQKMLGTCVLDVWKRARAFKRLASYSCDELAIANAAKGTKIAMEPFGSSFLLARNLTSTG